MKNQNSISKPTVISKPLPSGSTTSSSKKEKLPTDKKMEPDKHQQQLSDEKTPQNNDFSQYVNDTPITNETLSTPFTDKVRNKNICL